MKTKDIQLEVFAAALIGGIIIGPTYGGLIGG